MLRLRAPGCQRPQPTPADRDAIFDFYYALYNLESRAPGMRGGGYTVFRGGSYEFSKRAAFKAPGSLPYCSSTAAGAAVPLRSHTRAVVGSSLAGGACAWPASVVLAYAAVALWCVQLCPALPRAREQAERSEPHRHF